MKTPIRPKLKDLKVGDKFYPASKEGEATAYYEVTGDNHYAKGGKKRLCKNLKTGLTEFKRCDNEVIKVQLCIECGKSAIKDTLYCANCTPADEEPLTNILPG